MSSPFAFSIKKAKSKARLALLGAVVAINDLAVCGMVYLLVLFLLLGAGMFIMCS